MDARTLIREARRQAGLSLRVLAARAGTSHSTLAAYESGSKAPNTATLERIVSAAGFLLRVELVPLGPFVDHRERAAEIEQVLELADAFPVEHPAEMPYPRFASGS